MVSPLAPINYGPQDAPMDLGQAYLSGQRMAQGNKLQQQAIQQNNQQINQADYEQAVQKLSVINRLATKARSLPADQRPAFVQSINQDMLRSVGIDPSTVSSVQLDDNSLDSLIAQTSAAMPQNGIHGEAASFNEMTKDLSPEDREKARRVALGLDPRMQGSAAITIANQGLTGKVGASEAAIAGQKRGAENAQDIYAKPIIAGGVAQAQANVEAATKPAIEASTTSEKTKAEISSKKEAEAKANLPALEDTTQNLERYVDELKNHPGRRFATGGWSMIPAIPGTPQADFKSRLEQIQGGTFLQQYASLKGGGAITDVEGKKAEAAANRISAATSDEEFDKAVDDFKTILNQTLSRAKNQSSEKKSTTKLTYDPATGTFK